MHGYRLTAMLLLFLILTCGCAGNTPETNRSAPDRNDDARYLDLLDAFYSPLNQSYNPNIRQAAEMTAGNRKRAEDTLILAASYRTTIAALDVSPELEPSKEAFVRSLDELKAMSDYMLTSLYADKIYSEMSAEEQALADAYSVHSQNYGSLMPGIYNTALCSAVQENHRNLTQMCTLAGSLQARQ